MRHDGALPRNDLRRPAAQDRPRRDRAAGFTFLEILVVMALMAMLMGLGVGYMQSAGTGSRAAQARTILRETVYACQQSSNGGTRAILELRAGHPTQAEPILVGAAVAGPVLTHNFETVDAVSRDYPMDIQGEVEIVDGGYFGKAVKFGTGGALVFEPQAAFAMTEGLDISVWIQLDATTTATRMTILQGEGAYALQLQRDPEGTGYDVQLKLTLTGASGRTTGMSKTFGTKGGPVHRETGWTHLHVQYDGEAASIRVNGLERTPARPRTRRIDAPDDQGPTGPATELQRIAIPDEGTVRLSISDGATPFRGQMDSLVLGGVFRSREMRREIYGLELTNVQGLASAKLPVRIVFYNGRLDPDIHSEDVYLFFRDLTATGARPLRMKIGLYGVLEETFVKPAETAR